MWKYCDTRDSLVELQQNPTYSFTLLTFVGLMTFELSSERDHQGEMLDIQME